MVDPIRVKASRKQLVVMPKVGPSRDRQPSQISLDSEEEDEDPAHLRGKHEANKQTVALCLSQRRQSLLPQNSEIVGGFMTNQARPGAMSRPTVVRVEMQRPNELAFQTG